MGDGEKIMNEMKYTQDGKKVIVIGKLNSTEWIVQEMFVSEGVEVPGGEQFVAKTLLDKPAETYREKRIHELIDIERKLEISIESLQEKRIAVRADERANALINKFYQAYENIDMKELKTLVDFLSGRITHLVFTDTHNPRIVTLLEVIKCESDYGHQFEGFRLVSLFGCNSNGERHGEELKKKNYCLDWRLNQYRDGSGYYRSFIPCASFEEAVEELDKIAADTPVSSMWVKLKAKYGLRYPTEERIREYIQGVCESKREELTKLEASMLRKQAEIEEMEKKS